MRTKLTSILIFISIFICCSQKQNDYIDKLTLIELISKEDPLQPSLYSSIMLFCSTNQEGVLGITNSFFLQKSYNNDSTGLSYQKFVMNIMNQKLKIDSDPLDEYFSLNDTIIKSYEDNEFRAFLSKYTKEMERGVYSINTNLSQDEKLSVLFYLFENEYFSYFDDISGLYFSERLKILEPKSDKEN